MEDNCVGHGNKYMLFVLRGFIVQIHSTGSTGKIMWKANPAPEDAGVPDEDSHPSQATCKRE